MEQKNYSQKAKQNQTNQKKQNTPPPKKKKLNPKQKNPRHQAAWSLLLIRAPGLPLINNLCINIATDIILKYAASKMPTSSWIDLAICTTRDTQF